MVLLQGCLVEVHVGHDIVVYPELYDEISSLRTYGYQVRSIWLQLCPPADKLSPT